jgi:hypothetical protein
MSVQRVCILGEVILPDVVLDAVHGASTSRQAVHGGSTSGRAVWAGPIYWYITWLILPLVHVPVSGVVATMLPLKGFLHHDGDRPVRAAPARVLFYSGVQHVIINAIQVTQWTGCIRIRRRRNMLQNVNDNVLRTCTVDAYQSYVHCFSSRPFAAVVAAPQDCSHTIPALYVRVGLTFCSSCKLGQLRLCRSGLINAIVGDPRSVLWCPTLYKCSIQGGMCCFGGSLVSQTMAEEVCCMSSVKVCSDAPPCVRLHVHVGAHVHVWQCCACTWARDVCLRAWARVHVYVYALFRRAALSCGVIYIHHAVQVPTTLFPGSQVVAEVACSHLIWVLNIVLAQQRLCPRRLAFANFTARPNI